MEHHFFKYGVLVDFSVNKNNVLYIGIAIAVVITVIVLIFINIQEETITFEQFDHPCQQAVLDYAELEMELRRISKASGSIMLSDEYYQEWGQEYKIKEERFRQLLIDHDCYDANTNHPKGNWFTDEFKLKIFDLTQD